MTNLQPRQKLRENLVVAISDRLKYFEQHDNDPGSRKKSKNQFRFLPLLACARFVVLGCHVVMKNFEIMTNFILELCSPLVGPPFSFL